MSTHIKTVNFIVTARTKVKKRQ